MYERIADLIFLAGLSLLSLIAEMAVLELGYVLRRRCCRCGLSGTRMG